VRARAGAPPIAPAQVQPASIDLRLGPIAHRIRAGFLPSPTSIEERLRELSISTLSLEGEGAVFERGLPYMVRLEEDLALPGELRGRTNPRSSAGRCDLFTRVLCPGHPRFDEIPPGYRGELWLEIAPLSFPVRLRRGDRLCQMRLSRGRSALTTNELREVWRETPLAFAGSQPLAENAVRFDEGGGIELALGLSGRDPCGWRATANTEVLEFAKDGAHERTDYWEPVYASDGRAMLAPGNFYLFASRERLRIPPALAAEMIPVDVGFGEMRNNYAGFFDSGFGWREDQRGLPCGRGTPAVLEVRAHDLPFLVEDGQVFFRLRYFRTTGRPDRLYGEGRVEASYAEQDLTLARPFR
jgi:dCTP deaminase